MTERAFVADFPTEDEVRRTEHLSRGRAAPTVAALFGDRWMHLTIDDLTHLRARLSRLEAIARNAAAGTTREGSRKP